MKYAISSKRKSALLETIAEERTMPSEYELMLASEMYAPADEELHTMRQSARRLMHRFNHSNPDNQSDRRSILLELLGKIGINSEI